MSAFLYDAYIFVRDIHWNLNGNAFLKDDYIAINPGFVEIFIS